MSRTASTNVVILPPRLEERAHVDILRPKAGSSTKRKRATEVALNCCIRVNP
jgi:hypothetical protein